MGDLTPQAKRDAALRRRTLIQEQYDAANNQYDLDLDEAPFLDVHRCYDCRVCIPACPFGAITVRGVSIGE